MGSAAETTSSSQNNHNDDHVLRPRPRKPQHAQVRDLAWMASNEGQEGKPAHLTPSDHDTLSGRSR